MLFASVLVELNGGEKGSFLTSSTGVNKESVQVAKVTGAASPFEVVKTGVHPPVESWFFNWLRLI